MERTALPGRLSWQLGTLVASRTETARTRSLTLALPQWAGHRPGQHVDVRLTAEDGYRAERSYSIASGPETRGRITITVERLDDGEVSPYLVDELGIGDRLELRGPIGGYFTWTPDDGGPLLLVAGGSGVAPLMSMLRFRAEIGSAVPTTLPPVRAIPPPTLPPPAPAAVEPPRRAAPAYMPPGAPRIRVSFLVYSSVPARRSVAITIDCQALTKLHEGEETNGVQIVAIHPDPIEVEWQGGRYTIEVRS